MKNIWKKFTIDKLPNLPKGILILFADKAGYIDAIYYDFNYFNDSFEWMFFNTDHIVSKDRFETYKKYFIPRA